MAKRLTRIAPGQAGILFALVYFFLGVLVVALMLLFRFFAPTPMGPSAKPGLVLLIFLPFLYALIGLIFVPLGCWLYNIAARLVGGLQVTVTSDTDV